MGGLSSRLGHGRYRDRAAVPRGSATIRPSLVVRMIDEEIV